MKNFQEWLKTKLTKKELKDIKEHGVDNMFYDDISHYDDKFKLYAQFETDIWQAVFKDSDSQEDFHHNPFSYLGKLDQFCNVKDLATLKIQLVTYAINSIVNQM